MGSLLLIIDRGNSGMEISRLRLYVVQERKLWTSSDVMSVMLEIEAYFLDSPIMLTSDYDCPRAGRGPVMWVLSPLRLSSPQTMYFFRQQNSLFRQLSSLFRQVGSLFRQVGSVFRQLF